ncbi:protein phosphatase 2C domain-containing protein [Streptomyces sp. H27-H1]|uniref:protein phosphatase 2C domain-containing protein n=1 Tax=Streptomyces sp. H27-H1 TaxID=2996461 RepID=UPI00226FD9FA|nr:protein phosphatase 2C domain-containing protein [Streptomyces sp. H27-H1]MCY0925557.1 protein phosphatase 2C domain-containing protein [Streptomyces sp. H27-H1]
MSMHRLSGCPSCAEPLEEGDRFCGLCGHALTGAALAGAAPSGAWAPEPAPAPPVTPAAVAPAAAVAPPAHAPVAADPPTPPAGIPAGVPATRGRPSSDEGRATRHSGGYAEPAAAGYAGESAPGWGSVSTAAPTLVPGPTGWSAPGPHGAPAAPESPYATPPLGRHPADTTPYGASAQGAGSGAGAAYDGSATPGPGEQAARYDHPVPQAQHPGAEAPYGAATGGHGPAAQGDDGPQEPGAGHGVPYTASPAPQEYAPQGEAPYGAGPAQGHSPEGEAPHAGPAPQAETGGKTCVACRAGRVDTDGYCEHCGHAQPRERDHLEEELGSVAAVSDRGLRHHRNEDSFAVAATALPDGSAATVAIVCDGVSSASRPDEASAAAAAAANEALLEALPRGAHPQEAMHEAILAAATAVNALAPEVPGAQNAPACTLVGAVISSGLLTIGWVGDSRAYWVPDDRAALPRRLTEDDSWAAQMVAAGLMGEAEAYADVRAHAITGWLGADAYDLEPHTATFKPDHDGVVVVCTDGLWNYAESARDMARILPSDAAVRPLHSAQVLVGHALDGGGHDNVTVAIVPFSPTPPSPASSPATPQTQA